MTPQRRAGETSKTLDVQLGFGRDRKPKRRRNDMDKKLRLHRDCKTRMLPSPVYVEHDDGCRRKIAVSLHRASACGLNLGFDISTFKICGWYCSCCCRSVVDITESLLLLNLVARL